MRRSDAHAFCAWLSERTGGAWRYRLPDENHLSQADQGIWKNLSQDTCYWTEGERRYVWPQGLPSHSLYLLFQGMFTRAFARGLDRALNLVLNRTLAFDLDALDLDRDRDRDRPYALALDRALNLNFDRDLDRTRDRVLALARDRVLALALALYIHLFLLQERRKRRLPAWEGILLVKERILVV